MKRVLSLIVLLLWPGSSLLAAELFETNLSARALGMGNAFTAVVDDENSIFYNPAGLAKVNGINWTILDPYVGANGQDVYDIYQDFADGGSGSAFATQLRRLYGKKIWLGGGVKTAVAVPYFGFAAYDAFSGSAYLNNPAYPNLNVNFANDYGAALGFAFNLAPGVSMGFTGRRITRIGSAFPIGASSLALLSSDELQNRLNNRGTGYAVDFGSSFAIPGPVSPTFTFVWKNMGTTTFTQDFGAAAPPKMKDEMIAGFGLLVDGPGVDIRPAIDFKYLNRTDEQLGKKLHFGLEIDFPLIDFRGGLYQGYYTAGVGLDLGVLKADAATYGVELGEYPGQHEDRRYIVQITLELGFDPSFGFLKGDGKGGSASRRGLKPRR